MNKLNHLAIIMDGNGRWAKNQGLLRSFGHKAGAKNLENIVKVCFSEDIKELSLFAFSTENWKRPKDEVDFIFKLLKEYLQSQVEVFMNNDIRFNTFGDLLALDDETNELIKSFKNKTKDKNKLIFNLGINYGAKDELVRCFKKLKQQNIEINEENIKNNLDLQNDVDLLVRTGGHNRLSNFLLWQCAYAEIAFTNTLFPELGSDELSKIINDFKNCKRNFGGI